MSVSRLAREQPASRAGLEVFELPEWAASLGLIAGITARGADFGLQSAEPAGQVLGRWRAFRQGLAQRFPAVVVAHQPHGSAVATHGELPPGWHVVDGVDGHCTGAAGVLLTVTVADCVPVYLAEPRSGWFGLLHAGWRGVAAGVVERGIETLVRSAGCRAEDVLVHCGVGICGACYEVGPEVAEALLGFAGSGRERLDLRQLIAERARRSGVRASTVSPWCTAHDAGAFYSHRRSSGRDGRMVAYLGRPLA